MFIGGIWRSIIDAVYYVHCQLLQSWLHNVSACMSMVTQSQLLRCSDDEWLSILVGDAKLVVHVCMNLKKVDSVW